MQRLDVSSKRIPLAPNSSRVIIALIENALSPTLQLVHKLN